MWMQKDVVLTARPRGFHLVTAEVLDNLPEIRTVHVGLLHVFLQHTSAALTLNENASPDVRQDFEAHFNAMVPERQAYYTHTLEGDDDMPAHLKSSLLGAGLVLPVRDGRLHLGTWQGIYLCEHRENAGARRLTLTLHGE